MQKPAIAHIYPETGRVAAPAAGAATVAAQGTGICSEGPGDPAARAAQADTAKGLGIQKDVAQTGACTLLQPRSAECQRA